MIALPVHPLPSGASSPRQIAGPTAGGLAASAQAAPLIPCAGGALYSRVADRCAAVDLPVTAAGVETIARYLREEAHRAVLA